MPIEAFSCKHKSDNFGAVYKGMQGTPALDRQIQEFQFRIQQKLKLQDQEINRLSETLINQKTKIVESYATIARLDDQIRKVYEDRETMRKKRKIIREAAFSKQESNHFQQVQSLQEVQAKEIESLQTEFQEALEKIGQESGKKKDKEDETINDELENAREILQDLKDALEEAKTTAESQSSNSSINVQKIDEGVIEQLRESIKLRTEERMRNLKNSKEKLSQCVQLIEDLERKQEVTLQQLREKKSKQEQIYERTKEEMAQQRNIEREKENERLKEAQARYKRLQRLSRKREEEYANSMRQTMSEAESLRSSAGRVGIVFNEDIGPRVMRLREEVSLKKKLLKEADKALEAARYENDTLKADIGKIKHKLRFYNIE